MTSIQAYLDQQAINLLPRVKAEINKSSGYLRNRMINTTLRACRNAKMSIYQMTLKQKTQLESDLLTLFKAQADQESEGFNNDRAN